jgi:hypothetical protein
MALLARERPHLFSTQLRLLVLVKKGLITNQARDQNQAVQAANQAVESEEERDVGRDAVHDPHP